MDTKTIVREKPTIIQEGNKFYVSSRRWNDHALMGFLEAHPSKWHDIGTIAKIAYGQNIQNTRDRARRNVPKLFRYMLFQHGVFLIADYEPPHNSIKSIKRLDRSSPLECQKALEKLNKMHKRKVLSDDMYDRAMGIIGVSR